MEAPVYFWNLRASRRAPYGQRLKKLLKLTGVGAHLASRDLVAVKLHFGEAGTTGFVSPLLLKPLLQFLRKIGTRPFLTDTNTLYAGQRGESVSHALQAAAHGFDPNLLGAPVLIADGLKSTHEREVPFAGTHFTSCFLAGDIVDADGLVTVSHFKGHDLAGFGGALKNIGMGCATRKGKMHQHCGLGPQTHPEHCTGCGACIEVCLPGALRLQQGRISLDPELCAGCAACLPVCRHRGLSVNWTVETNTFLERMAEYAAATLKTKPRPCLHLSFVTQVSPGCDCTGFNDAPICPDQGVLASLDPVALDQAALDLVNAAPPLHPSALPEGVQPGRDKFRAIHPRTDGTRILEYAENLGLGSRKYQLITI